MPLRLGRSARPGREPGGRTVVEYFAANIDIAKSNLEREDADEFRVRLSEMGIAHTRSAEDIWQLASENQADLWRIVLIMLASVMALESFLGWKFGHHQK